MNFFCSKIDSRKYAALRITFGLLALFTIIGLLPEAVFYYSDEGWLSAELATKLNPREWSVLQFIRTGVGIRFFFAIEIGICLSMILGYRTRICTWLLFIGLVSLQSRNWFNSYGGDALLRLMIFYLGFSDAGRVWSLDAYFRRKKGEEIQVSAWPLRLIQIQICLLYFTTGLAKLHGGEWVTGTALSRVLLNPLFARFDFSFLVNYAVIAALLVFLTKLVLLWEITFPFLVWNRRTRPFVLWMGVGVHLGIFVFLQIHWFGLITLGTYLAFIRPESIPHSVDAFRRVFTLTFLRESSKKPIRQRETIGPETQGS